MTSIEKLHISGVRSFNPNPTERQTIVFHKPLTIILGKNGAGKTTIIEALLNATTGEMPPGAAMEKSAFVYDPKAAGETEVKAQIRLIFTARGGKPMQVIRSFQASRAKGKTKFETLDAVLACKDDASGKVQSATYRCSDVDRMVPELLGVSRAVLEHVIFCHQEDCNWPLGPPGEVKKRFDDIFASTRYVAALDKLRETAKEYKDQQKQNEANLIALREHREQAKGMQGEIDGKEEQIRLIEARNKEIEPRLRQLTAAIAAMDAIASKAEAMTHELHTLRGRVDEKERARQALGVAPTPQSLDEVKQMQREYATQMQAADETIKQTQGKIAAAEAARRAQEAQIGEQRAVLLVAQREAEEHKQRVQELQKVVQSITNEFVAGEADVDERALARAEEAVAQRLADAQKQRDEATATHEAAAKQLTAKRDVALRAMDADAKERTMADQRLASLTQRIATLSNALPKDAAATLQALQQQVTELEARVEAEQAARREGKAQREVQTVMGEIDALDAQLAELSAKMDKSKADAEVVVRMGFLRSTIAEREAETTSTLDKQLAPALKAAGAANISVPLSVDNAAAAARALKTRKASALAQADDQARQADREVATLEQRIHASLDAMSTMERSLVEKRAVVSAAMDDAAPDCCSRFEALRTNADERLRKAQRKLTSLESMAKCYESFIASAKTDKACVVCKRPLDDHGVDAFVKTNEDRQRTTPQQIDAARAETQAASEVAARLAAVAHQAADVVRVSAELPPHKAAHKKLEEDLRAKKALLGDLSTKSRELQRHLDTADGLCTRIDAVAAGASEVAKLRLELDDLTTQFNHGAAVKRVPRDVMQKEYDDKRAELQQLSNRLVRLQRDNATATDSAASGELQQKRAALMEADLAMRRGNDVEQQLVTLRDEVATLTSRVAAITERKSKLQAEADECAKKIEAAEARHKAQRGQLDDAVRGAERDCRVLEETGKSVKHFVRAGGPDRTGRAQVALRDAEAQLRQSDADIKELTASLAKARSVVDEQYRRSAQINELIQAKQLEADIAATKQAAAAAEVELAALRADKVKDVAALLGPSDGATSIARTRDECRSKIGELERARAQNQGSLEMLLHDVNERRGTLAKDKYREIDKRYTSTFVKVQTTEMAIEDIEKYYRALEKAVSSYHAEKVAQINKIVADLWRLTYRGSDIDSIEIRSEDDSTGSMARRSYKYRVVMRRGDTELDMRGRCSAGQKVLAAVIIRMALSEAFCCDCGILALDEPTTNLDDDNAQSLAQALRELISARRNVQHFQLVVITHDEQFVKALGGNHRADTFYFVQKDREGAFSVIQERQFGDLFIS